MPNRTTYLFDGFRLDRSKRLLLRAETGEVVSLTHKAFGVLLLLVENSGESVTKVELMETVWKDSFVEDANLTQTISVLRKALGENPNDHRFIVTETGKGYRFVANVDRSSEDEASIETETDGLRREKADKDTPSRKPSTYLFCAVMILTIVCAAAAYYFFSSGPKQNSLPKAAGEVKTIAVLPFKYIGSVNDDTFLGIGMADAVITKLSKLKSIVVRQTSTVIRYADSTPEAIRVGREINVDAILEGRIQVSDGRIRVSVRMFRVGDGALLWAESFDEPETDIFALQDSISEKVATALSLKLNPAERVELKRRYTENIEAFQLYNKGRFFWNNRNSDDLRKSIGFYEQAIAKDENYALAYAGLAESYVLLQLFTQSQEKDFFPNAKRAAEKALSLDDQLAGAHAAFAVYKEQYEWDWDGAEVSFKRAIAANPSYATAHQWYGEYLAFMGRTRESVIEVEKAFELDPLSLSTNTARAFPYLAAGQYDQAIEKLKPVFELDKEFPLALYYLGRSYDGKGSYDEARDAYQQAIALSGKSTFFASAMIYSLVKNGQRDEAGRVFAEISAIAKNQPLSSYILARSHAALGNREKALSALEKALRERDGLLLVIKIDQNFDTFRAEPRFKEIIKQMRY